METRRVRHADGRQEIIRLLTTVELSEWSGTDPLSYEKSIVWLDDISTLPFVRVAHVKCARSRRGRIRLSGGDRLIGYAKLMADAPRDPATRSFTRRVFYLREGDLSGASKPSNGRVVDPRSVLPGAPGDRPKP